MKSFMSVLIAHEFLHIQCNCNSAMFDVQQMMVSILELVA